MKGNLWSETESKKKAHGARKLAGITIDITNRCDAGCKFCYNSSTPQSKHRLNDNDVFRLIDQAKELGAFEITWGGGEPLLHDGILRFVEYAYERGIASRITTSGQPISDLSMAAELCRLASSGALDELRVQVNSVDRARFLEARDTYPTFFDELMVAFENLKTCQFPIRTHLTICVVYLKGCSSTFADVCKWAIEDLGVAPGRIMTVAFKSQGFGKSHPELRASDEELSWCREHLKSLAGTKSFESEYSEINCATVVHVSPNGDVIPCALLPIPHGNIKHESLVDIVGLRNGPAGRKEEIVEMLGPDAKGHECAATLWDERPELREEFKKRRLPVVRSQGG